MNIHSFFVRLSTGLLCIALAACATGGGMAPTAFPAGSYASGDVVLRLNADGTTLGTDRSGNDWGKGTYTVDGDVTTMTDQWYADANLQACIGVPGKYRWAYADRQLRFEPIEDRCQQRVDGIGTGPWTRVD